MRSKQLRRGDVFLPKPPGGAGGRAKGRPMPVVVVQNDFGNRYSPATIVAAVRKEPRRGLPVHVAFPKGWGEAPRMSVIDCAMLSAIPVKALGARLGRLPPSCMLRVDEALKLALSIR